MWQVSCRSALGRQEKTHEKILIPTLRSADVCRLCGGEDATDSATQQVTYEPAATSAPATEMPQEAEEVIENEADTQSDEAVADRLSQLRLFLLSPTATEMLFAIGAGDQVIAVDNYSYYPPQAPVVDDLSGFSPNVEAIAAFRT